MSMRYRKLSRCALLGVCLGCLGFPLSAQADGWYLGADLAVMDTTLEYGGVFSSAYSESYATGHARLKGGYNFAKYFGAELRLTSSGDDTYVDSFGTWKWRTGESLSGYFKPHYEIGHFDIYGLVGLSVMDTSYEAVAGPQTGQKDKATLATFDFGVGGIYLFTPHFGVSAEIKLNVGTADYKTLLGSTDIYGAAFGAGVVFRF